MSMSIYGFDTGQFDTKPSILGTTSATVVTNVVGNWQIIVNVLIANVTAGAVVFSLEIYDGTTSTYLVRDYSLAAKGGATAQFALETPIRLASNQSLRVTAASGNALHVVVGSVTHIPARGGTS